MATDSVAEKLRLASSGKDVRTAKFWAGTFAEFVGTMMFVLIGVGSVMFMGQSRSGLHVALGVGLALATNIWVTAAISGGHLNPAVSFAMLFMRKMSLVRFIFYVLAQCLGAIVAVALLRLLTPSDHFGNFGTTLINEKLGVTIGQGLGTEILLTFMLVLTIFASCDGARTDLKGSAPLAIGIAVAIGHLFALHSTGASMNPARSLGSAAVSGLWTNHWVYWVGPFIGATCAGLLYDLIFAADASMNKASDWFLGSVYPPTEL